MTVWRSGIFGAVLVEWLVAGPHLRPVLAQQRPPGSATAAAPSRPIASAVQVTVPPVIYGVLDDRAWQDATPLAGFVQSEPFEGQPASESTEVRILYDDQAIYVGVVCHDSDPSQIVTTDTRRDAVLGEMDSLQIIFDTFRDQQNGFVFGTNAAGI